MERRQEATFEILKLFRLLRVFRVEELQSDYLNDKACLLEFVEEGYNFWKRHQRFSVLFNAEGSTLQVIPLRSSDPSFNNDDLIGLSGFHLAGSRFKDVKIVCIVSCKPVRMRVLQCV